MSTTWSGVVSLYWKDLGPGWELRVSIAMHLKNYEIPKIGTVQSIPEKMKLKMLVEMLDGQNPGLFSNEPFEKRPVMTIEHFVLHSDAFRVSSSQNGLYQFSSGHSHLYIFFFLCVLPPHR